jgi:hypothetical protein
MIDINKDSVPEYDVSIEQRQSVKEGEIVEKGIWVGRGDSKCLIDPKVVYLMGSIGCHDSEIADWFGITENTLRFNFRGFLTKARSELKQKLRRAQLSAALNGQPTMLVWLGRNLLGQSENPHNNSANEPLPWMHEEIQDNTDMENDHDSD